MYDLYCEYQVLTFPSNVLDILLISYCTNSCFVEFSCLKNILAINNEIGPNLVFSKAFKKKKKKKYF